ncbi:MAG: ABC transporter ATP-binding protein [Polyangiales bacterium]
MQTSSPLRGNARLLARLLRIAWDHRGRCVLVLGVQVLLLALSVLGLGWTGSAMDVLHRALRPEAPAPRWPWGIAPPSTLSPWQLVLGVALAIVGIAVARALLSYVYTVGVADLVQGRIVPSIRARVYAKLQALSFSFYDENASGGLLNRVTSDVQYLRSFVDGVMIQALVVSLALLIYGGYMATVHAGLTLVCLATTPLLLAATLIFSRRVLPAHARAREQLDSLVAGVSEAVQGMSVIQGFAVEARFLDDLIARNRRVRDGQQAIFREVSRFTPSIDLLTQLNVAAMLAYGGLLVSRGTLTVGELVVFGGLLQQFTTHVQTMSTIVNTLQESLIGARRVFEVLDAEVAVRSPRAPKQPVRRTGELVFDDVRFGYGAGPCALEGVRLTVRPGELVALFGAAGAGKSSMLGLVPRFYDVSAGRVLVDGIDVREHDLSVLRRRTAYVFQESFLFSNTVAANIAFARPDATRTQIEEAARRAAAHAFISALPSGYDTMLGEWATNLSGGQRQRLAIARALLTDPRLLLLDDPTAALDAETTLQILESIRGATEGRTTLLVTHQPQLLKHADRVVVLEQGRVVQEGTHATLIRAPGPYQRALGEPLTSIPRARAERSA